MGRRKLNVLWGRYCCDCLGELCHIKLRRKDCYFSQLGVGECRNCGETHHLVMDTKFIVRCKLWFKLLFDNEFI